MKKLTMLFLLVFVSSLFAITPEEIQEAYHKSFNYEQIEDYENAIRSLSSVLDEYPNGYTVNLRLGWLYYLLGRYANSIEHYQKAVQIVPTSLEAKNGLMLPMLAQNKYGDAVSIAYQVVSVDHYNYYGNMRLAYSLRMEKKYDQAEQILNKMLAVYPTDITFLTELALVKYNQGDKEKAGNLMWDVLTLDPENETAKNYFKK
jgi:tetratricopeptide (TPR) repeat protein